VSECVTLFYLRALLVHWPRLCALPACLPACLPTSFARTGEVDECTVGVAVGVPVRSLCGCGCGQSGAFIVSWCDRGGGVLKWRLSRVFAGWSGVE